MKRYFNIFFAFIWLINGLLFKVLAWIPRHEEIVGEILNLEEASLLTTLIGSGETILGIIILMNWKPKLMAWLQVFLILSMNIIEFVLVPHLLMFGNWNLLFATFLSFGILLNQDSFKSFGSSLKNHPFTIMAHFNYCYVFTFSMPIEDVKHLVYRGLSPDAYKNKFAFYTIAIVDSQRLRPSFLHENLGSNFLLIGHRIFVRLKSQEGKIYRGLQILKSETDSLRMKIIGNLFTHYNYHKIEISISERKEEVEICVKRNGFKVLLSKNSEKVGLPESSPFKSWKEARKFVGPMPFTFSELNKQDKILTVLGKRDQWQSEPVEVKSIHLSDYEKKLFPNSELASAFKIKNVDYQWEKGEIIKF